MVKGQLRDGFAEGDEYHTHQHLVEEGELRKILHFMDSFFFFSNETL